MNHLLVSLLVALPALALGEVTVDMLSLEKDSVKQCALNAGISADQYANVLSTRNLPESRDDKCKIIVCNLQGKDFVKDGNIDYTVIETKFKTEIPQMFSAKAAVPDFLECAEKPDGADAKDTCDQAVYYLGCIFYKALKYAMPLLEATTPAMRRCQMENNASEDEVAALDYKAEAPNSREGKCMLACLLRDKGAVFEDKLDADYIYAKIVDDVADSRVSRYAPSVSVIIEDFKKCAPNVTDPTGSKDLCEGAFDIYDCMFKVEKKYYPKGTANN